ncbi:hypothetical protein MPTK1_6g00720 [Marchantia polymorpha subsp. ruderalis]|uniref:Uncharacterized protein n=2 Tax=Marchantia polymorpha TaxID=3197 RepID=A0AAF6BM59_MARPO|nr:hypothetical protein MARPO_0052s0128 [Marchantia polymorpha]BBN13093.1 hypothetical protein Mp_6g00720 [Marchantia polymorpha subsp. ruderalis]|eukprot:PTQ38354.1 hypothetical protein MARPO_0052s0128 [Marchantia polymorpha]
MQCHGTISCLYGSFLNLEKFTLSGSGFTGTVPLELCNLVDVLFLDLGQLSHRRLSLVTFPTSSTISRPSMPAKISSRALFKISFLAGAINRKLSQNQLSSFSIDWLPRNVSLLENLQLDNKISEKFLPGSNVLTT